MFASFVFCTETHLTCTLQVSQAEQIKQEREGGQKEETSKDDLNGSRNEDGTVENVSKKDHSLQSEEPKQEDQDSD